MSNLISQNYRAGEKLHQGQIVAIDTDSAVYDPHVVGAKSGDDIIGICKNDCEVNDLAVVYSIVPGQYQPVLVAEDVSAGDRLAITSDGDVVAYDGSQDGVEQLPLVAMGNGSGAIDAVGCRLTTGAVDGDLEIDGDLDVKGDLSIGSATITEDDITFYDEGQQKSIAFKDLGGGGGITLESLFATEEDGMTPAVGSIGLYELYIGDSQNHYYGEEVTMTYASASAAKSNSGTGATCCGPLHINIGELSDKLTWINQSGRKSLPVDAKIRILNGLDGNAGIVLAIRTA